SVFPEELICCEAHQQLVGDRLRSSSRVEVLTDDLGQIVVSPLHELRGLPPDQIRVQLRHQTTRAVAEDHQSIIGSATDLSPRGGLAVKPRKRRLIPCEWEHLGMAEEGRTDVVADFKGELLELLVRRNWQPDEGPGHDRFLSALSGLNEVTAG